MQAPLSLSVFQELMTDFYPEKQQECSCLHPMTETTKNIHEPINQKFQSSKLSDNLWNSPEYKLLYGVKSNESNVYVAINNIVDILELGMVEKFKGVMYNFFVFDNVKYSSNIMQKLSIHLASPLLLTVVQKAIWS